MTTTQANVTMKAAQKAVYDKVESEIHRFETQLATLKANAESIKADAEISAIANLAATKRTLDVKLVELKRTGEAAFEQVRADVERGVSEFDKALRAIASKINLR